MKKFLTLMALLGLGYFISFGCIYRYDSSEKYIKNKIVSIYYDSDRIVFLGEVYSYYVSGAYTGNDYLRYIKDEILIFNHIAEEKGVYLEVDSTLNARNTLVGKRFELSIMIDIKEASVALISWAKELNRTVYNHREGSKSFYRKEEVFYEKEGFLRGDITFNAVTFKSDTDYLSTVKKLDTPFTLLVDDLTISKKIIFPSRLQAKSKDIFIKHIGLKIQSPYEL